MLRYKLNKLKQKSNFENNLKLLVVFFLKYLRISIIILFLPILVFLVFFDLWLDTPSLANQIDSNQNNGSLIIDKNTNLVLASYPGQAKYESVSLYKIPENLVKAVLILEDKNFFDNPAGIPWGSLVKVNVDCVTNSSDQCRGGSGIVQQLVKNTKVDESRTVNRKVTELFLSIKLSQNVSKQKVLEAYLNNVYYGQNSYGVETASKTYFGHSITATNSAGTFFLSNTKACFLASLLQSPDNYSQSVLSEKASDNRFTDRINFCQKNIDLADLSYFEVVGNKPTYYENIQTEELINQVKSKLNASSKSTDNQSKQTPTQIITNKANAIILENYSQAVLRSKNWIFYADYDKNIIVDKDLKVEVYKNDVQKCKDFDCQDSSSDLSTIYDFRLLSWNRILKYFGWVLIGLGIVYFIQKALQVLYFKIAHKNLK